MGELEKLKQDCIVKQKRGLHIIIASIVVWGRYSCSRTT